jgi:hypothetical protein
LQKDKAPPTPVHICPGSRSPNQRHYYDIDDDNHGVCRWCQAEGYFPSLLDERLLAGEYDE